MKLSQQQEEVVRNHLQFISIVPEPGRESVVKGLLSCIIAPNLSSLATQGHVEHQHYLI